MAVPIQASLAVASLQPPKAASGPRGHTANSDCRDGLRERPSATWVSFTRQLKSKLSPKGQRKLDQAFVLSRLRHPRDYRSNAFPGRGSGPPFWPRVVIFMPLASFFFFFFYSPPSVTILDVSVHLLDPFKGKAVYQFDRNKY